MDKYPDLNGKSITFTIAGVTKTALIESYLASGRTSDVYLAFLVDEPKSPKIIVKVPKAGFEDSEFLNEYEVVTLIIQQQDENPNVPRMYKGDMDGTEIIIMENLSPEERWMAQRGNKDFQEKGLLIAVAQYIDLFDLVHEMRISNQDIKGENFYWFEEDQRFVLLDWNRCQEHNQSGEQAEQKFINIQNQTYKILLGLLYEVYTGQSLPNPLPSVDSTEPSHWVNFPRSLRRMINDAYTDNQISPQYLRNSLMWHQEIQSLFEAGDHEGLISKADDLINSGDMTELELVEPVTDILALLPQELGSSLKVWRDELLLKTKTNVTQVVEEVVNLLGDLKIDKANQLLMEFAANRDYSKEDQWVLARWLTIGAQFKSYENEYDLIDSQEAKTLVDFFSKEQGLRENQQGVYAAAQKLQHKLNEAEKFINDPSLLRQDISSETKLTNLKEISDKLAYFRDQEPVFLEETMQVMERNLPKINTNILQEDVAIKEYKQKQNDAYRQLNEKLDALLKTALSETYQYPFEDISEIYEGVDFKLPDNLQTIFKAHQEARYGRYMNSLGFIRDNPDELVSKQRRILEHHIKEWIKKVEDRTYPLYKDDIEQLEMLLKQLGETNFQYQMLSERLLVAREAKEDDLESLQMCKEMNLEPWGSGPDDELLSVEHLLRILKIKEYSNLIRDIQEETDKIQQPDYFTDLSQLVTQLEEKLEQISILKLKDSLSFITKLQEENQIYYKLLKSGDVLVINELLMYLYKGEMDIALKLGREVIESRNSDPTDENLVPGSMVFNWTQQLEEIIESDQQKDYINWFAAVGKDDYMLSSYYAGELSNDHSKPVYEYLYTCHLNLEYQGGKLWRFFKQGKLEEIKQQLNEFNKQEEQLYITKEISEWQNRINQTETMVEFILNDTNPEWKFIMKTLLPDVWKTAELIAANMNSYN